MEEINIGKMQAAEYLPEDLPDPDSAAYTRWTYADMEREFAETFGRLTAAGCEPSAAALYVYGMIGVIDTAGKFEAVRFTEMLMAMTVYYRFVLENDIPLADTRPARMQFEDYAALVEIWGDRHYKGLELSAEDGEKLRTESYAVLSGLTRRTLDEGGSGRPEKEDELSPEQKMNITELLKNEIARIKNKYLLIRVLQRAEMPAETEDE